MVSKDEPRTPKSYYIATEKLPGFQRLMGGVPRGTITASLGAPGAGKSSLFMQLSVEIAKSEKGNVLIFDTENSFHTYLELSRGLAVRYNMDINVVRVRGDIQKSGTKTDPVFNVVWTMEDEVDPKATNVFVIHCPDITPLSIMWGRGVELKIYESGKFKIMMTPGAWAATIEESPIAQFFVKNKCKVILIDSVTNPLDEIPAVGENFPARADLTQILMIQFHKVAAFYDVPVLATFHESKNETNPFSKQLKIEGGKGVGYNLKFIVYMLLQNELGLLPKGAVKPKTLARDERGILVARHPGRKPWSQVEYVTITSQGMTDGEVGAETDEEEDLVTA